MMNSMSKNKALSQWVREIETLCTPDSVYWCNGSKEEYDRLMKLMVDGWREDFNDPKLPVASFRR